jgi:alkylated DNA repair dioxygenase AlkB
MSEFLENGFLLLPNFIDREEAIEIGNNYLNFARKYNIKRYSLTVCDQRVASDEYINYKPIFHLLNSKIEYLSGIVEEPLLPTYSYIRTYKTGNHLTPHRDKEACEISLTLHMTSDDNSEYPFYIESLKKERKSIILEPGDAILYLGSEVLHGRPKYVTGYRYVQSFLHYVRANGEFKECHERNKIFYPENMRKMKNAESEV